jgi:NTF2 fold immunity protein
MKKRILLIIISVSIILGVFLSIQAMAPERKQRNYVPNKETAIKIAEAIWLPIFDKEIYKHKPFNVELKSDSIWHVYGTRPATNYRGGTPHIYISKKDCRVLGYHCNK